MGSSSDSTPRPSFHEVFRASADPSGRMSFESFMALALYHPQVGYYRRSRSRVGFAPGTDFFTATSTGPLFGELVAAACEHLLQKSGRDPSDHRFVEIGAEPAQGGILAGIRHPFREVTIIRCGEPISLGGNCVVFSNELFDAQPCRRSVFRQGRWMEIGVQLEGKRLMEIELRPDPTPRPTHSVEGYCFDQPLVAAQLAAEIAAQPWWGLFITFDYGKTLRELSEETPGGTARAYYRHTQTSDLLARPGEQDLTCHVCWDWLEDALRQHGFANPSLSFQEAFFIRNAAPLIAATSAAEATRSSPRKQALMQLLHPGQMGQKFQVLHALR